VRLKLQCDLLSEFAEAVQHNAVGHRHNSHSRSRSCAELLASALILLGVDILHQACGGKYKCNPSMAMQQTDLSRTCQSVGESVLCSVRTHRKTTTNLAR